MELLKNIKHSLAMLYFRYAKDIETLESEFNSMTSDFVTSQKNNLQNIIDLNSATRWGRDHGFSVLKAKDWSRVEVTDYDSIKPYIDRIMKGDFHSLTYQKPLALTMTSGTTGDPKYIPVTLDSFLNQEMGESIWKYSIFTKYSKHLDKLLILSGGKVPTSIGSIPIMSCTDILKNRQEKIASSMNVFPASLDYLADLEHRLLVSAQQCFITRPSMVVSVNPLTAARMIDLFRENKQELVDAVKRRKYIGTDTSFKITGDLAKLCKNIESSENPISDILLMGSWLGGTQHIFVDKLRSYGCKFPFRDMGYMATEGRFSIPLEDNTPVAVLNPFGNYYEFMKLDSDEIVPTTELDIDGEYRMVVTGFNGLYKYNMNDIVQVTGRAGKDSISAPLVKFRRKAGNYSSITGEKLHENNVVDLLSRVGINGGAFLVARSDPPHYDMIVNEGVSIDIDTADLLLQELNPEYLAKRDGGRLHGLNLMRVTPDVFDTINNRVNPNRNHDRFKQRFMIPLNESHIVEGVL